ncbi:MAG TPA: TolC family protein [Steroidobacteraceae bacterium]|nr:TolC family protein [Steroidobacteraceae bacterium]
MRTLSPVLDPLRGFIVASGVFLAISGGAAQAQQTVSGATSAQEPPEAQSATSAPTSSASLPSVTSAQPSAGPAQPIDLPTALRLAGMNNLDLALVRAAARLAKAENDAATLHFFPWLTLGQTYTHYTGADQSTPGTMLEVDRQLYRRSASAGVQLDLGNAIFQKLAARQIQSEAEHTVQARGNDTLLAAADAYFDLVDSRAQEGIAREAVRISRDYGKELQRAVAIGLTNQSEALRVSVRTQQDEVRLSAAQATERRASAALAAVLRLDPAIVLFPTERVVSPPALVPLDTPLKTLVSQALLSRPELKASEEAVAAAEHQRTAAKFGPLIPSISAEAIYGQARGGLTGALTKYRAAHDYVVGLNWQLGPGGLLDFSRTEAADSNLDTQRLGELKVRQQISEQVVDALSAARSAYDQMRLAGQGVELAQKSLDLSMQRRQFGVYSVLEVIQAQEDLTRARSDYANALAGYAKSQYALARAIDRIGS